LVSRLAKVLAADILLAVAGYFVFEDVSWRVSYAASEGLVPSTSYLPFVKVFTMAGPSFPLRSPPTLDWLQVLAALFIIVNVWFVFATLGDRKGSRRQAKAAAP